MTDEERLSAGFRAGRKEAFAEFVRQYEPRAIQAAWRMLGSSTHAADAVQDAFLRAWRGRAGFRGDAKLGTWFYRILMSACTDIGRRLTSRKRREDARIREDIARGSTHPAPEDAVVAADLCERVKEALDGLSENQKRVFVLRHFEEKGPVEIARVLGMAEGTVKSHLARAVAALRKRLRSRLGFQETGRETSS